VPQKSPRPRWRPTTNRSKLVLAESDFRKALDEMSEDQRVTLRLFFFEGYTLQEIARRLGQSIGQVKHHYYRGLDRLRRHLPKG